MFSLIFSLLLLQADTSGQSPLEGLVSRPAALQARYETDPASFIAPSWAEQLSLEYPAAALEVAAGGSATVSCIVDVQGHGRLCQLDSETPHGLGFGEVVMAAQPKMKFNAATIDGQTVESVVTFTSSFEIPPTVKPSPKLAAAIQAIGVFGYWTAVCRDYVDVVEIRRWEDMPAATDTVDFNALNPFDQLFIQSYVAGKGASKPSQTSQSTCEQALENATAEVDRLHARDNPVSLLEAETPRRYDRRNADDLQQ